MNTLSELITFKGTEDASKFFYLYENVVTKSLPDIEKAEKIVAYLTGAAFDFYFDRLTLDNAPTEEATTQCFFSLCYSEDPRHTKMLEKSR